MSSGSSVAHTEVGSWVYFHDAFQDFQQIRPESAVLQSDQSGALRSVVLHSLGQRWRESFWSPFVVPFQCLEYPSLDRVTRSVSSTPDMVSPEPFTAVQQFVRASVDVSCHLVRFLDRHSTVVAG